MAYDGWTDDPQAEDAPPQEMTPRGKDMSSLSETDGGALSSPPFQKLDPNRFRKNRKALKSPKLPLDAKSAREVR